MTENDGLLGAGLHSLTPAEARVYEVLAQAGLFEAGAVIVGTQAFLHTGNMLCVHWARGMGQTEDIDIARERTIAVASPPVETDIRETLLQADKGVLALNPVQFKKPAPDRIPADTHAGQTVRQTGDSQRPERGGRAGAFPGLPD